jgi:curved DNA-binding protein CbpA
MKNFHPDTGDGSDDEEVKLINAAYDEYKKKHGI